MMSPQLRKTVPQYHSCGKTESIVFGFGMRFWFMPKPLYHMRKKGERGFSAFYSHFLFDKLYINQHGAKVLTLREKANNANRAPLRTHFSA